jgi:hypothetical protein
MAVLKQPDLSGVSDEVRKYVESLSTGYDEMIGQLEKATQVIEELTDEDEEDDDELSDESDDDDDDTDDDEDDDDERASSDKKKSKVGKSDLDSILKAHPEVAQAISKAQAAADAATKRAEQAEKIAKKERDQRLEGEFIAKAKTLDALGIEHDPVAKALQEMAEKVTPETNETIWKTLHAANEQARSGEIFKEIGSSARGGMKTGEAETDLTKAANALMERNKDMTYTEAITKAVADDPNLYHEYVEEQRQARK